MLLTPLRGSEGPGLPPIHAPVGPVGPVTALGPERRRRAGLTGRTHCSSPPRPGPPASPPRYLRPRGPAVAPPPPSLLWPRARVRVGAPGPRGRACARGGEAGRAAGGDGGGRRAGARVRHGFPVGSPVSSGGRGRRDDAVSVRGRRPGRGGPSDPPAPAWGRRPASRGVAPGPARAGDPAGARRALGMEAGGKAGSVPGGPCSPALFTAQRVWPELGNVPGQRR